MPATESTWRNQKSLHVVFGVSSLAMLATTIWLLAADHAREAKTLQKQFNLVETRTLEWRKTEQETAAFETKRNELEMKLAAERATVPPRPLIDRFLDIAETKPDNGYDPVAVADRYEAFAKAAAEPAPAVPEDAAATAKAVADQQRRLAKLRNDLLAAMQRVLDRAVFVENEAQRKLKFTKADLDVDVSMLAIAIDEGKPAAEVEAMQTKVSTVRSTVENDLTPVYQQAKSHRLALLAVLTEVKEPEAAVQKEMDKHDGDVARTMKAYKEKKPNAGKWFLEQPVVDAFNGPLKPAQIWLPDLTWNNNFRNVARFDRCNTCHQGIEKTAPGSAVVPAYEAAHDITVMLETPKLDPTVDMFGEKLNARLQKAYGMVLAEQGLFNTYDVTIEAVFSGGAAIRADLRAGDVIVKVGDVKIIDLPTAENYLLQSVTWGKPLKLTVRRGVPHPYASHPKLDLFVGSMSPHKIGDFGCTVCHEGQGNGTTFKFTSHTPNNPEIAAKWATEWGWFNNHHWIYPMLPERFQEANCLKCHHDVTELKPSKKFKDPPAPKLVAGFERIEDVGCFGCHEIQGYDGPKKRRGPDLRVEPNIAAAAEQVLGDAALSQKGLTGNLAQIVDLAQQSVAHPESASNRKRLAELLRADAEAGADGKSKPLLTPATHAMATILGADDEAPGQYRKVGPSLRHVKAKNDENFLYSWVMNPANFRPSTKMPRFFGLHDHLVDIDKVENGKVVMKKDAHGHEAPVKVTSQGKIDAERFEPIEALAISKYLLTQSQPFEYSPKAQGVEAADAARGRMLFETRGCLACHSHADFPKIKQKQGPDLSGLGAKFAAGGKGQEWLYTWLKNPSKYHPRTLMPVLFLDPLEVKDKDGKVTGKTDPAADIAAYLLSHKTREDGKPFAAEAPPTVKPADLDELLALYLSGAFTRSETKEVLAHGIPEARRSQIKGDEQLLVSNGTLTLDQKLVYLGKKTIGRLGCAGCHDVPGFEDAKPIGTGLADWGRKEPSKLAFEQILAYLAEKDGHGHGAETGPPDLDKGFFMDALGHHQREGFLWQKLREPRSYDYMKTENKSYIDRLRMPKFNLTEAERESIMTVVLGLVAEPPAARYVYRPNAQMAAVLAGQRALDKFNCAGCHTLEMQQWEIDYQPGKTPAPSTAEEYAFLVPHYSPTEAEASKKTDRRGLGRAELIGLPQPKEDDAEPLVYFKLWRPALIDGLPWLSVLDYPVDEKLNPPQNSVRYPQVGGVFANYLHPVAFELEKKNNPQVKASDAWGFVPPPLNQEGRKVQSKWLHDFLLDPYPIRPAVILRMPKFNMTSAEAEAIADHFAAQDGVDFPYEFDPRTREEYLAAQDSLHKNRLDDAFKLITDQNFCVKCHKIGDFTPKGSAAALAPNLADVHRRIRPEFLRDWIANPARLLPYTGMPVNFPKNKPADQKLFAGTAEEQVQAVVDLLLNYDEIMTRKTSIAPLIKIAPPADTPPPPTTGGDQ